MRVLTRISLVACSLLAVQLVRCGGSDATENQGLRCEGALPAVVYDGDASDEAIERVWDKRCTAEAVAGAATLSEPAAGAVVGSSVPATLRWEQAIAALPGGATRLQAPAGVMPQLAFGLPLAWAHLPPVTGWVYLVEMKLADGSSLWLFTTERSWQPDPIAWRRLVGSGEVSVEITSTYLNQNVIEEGPWLGERRTFSIGEK
ncbi:hypothetical protein [Vulgatibacter sp.]|uniref:hypothetical protein n=1 Tax=Vulgatibacter sp. TaxID=1971226 RepID=UPI0035674853